ncbi:hypothetical protein L1987_69371 [Smallanthus sonchifolius]|uniref:Uncharacterized protein n=1 Tax=Smallanthus sonchifolius TaxID=185202 RepID=A0ACB9B737_9ASTR|nr:hypothetical protein L1987_69371 [Smallanthus sonchifolius]
MKDVSLVGIYEILKEIWGGVGWGVGGYLFVESEYRTDIGLEELKMKMCNFDGGFSTNEAYMCISNLRLLTG